MNERLDAMANNKMFLVYRPTGDAVYLGKRMAQRPVEADRPERT